MNAYRLPRLLSMRSKRCSRSCLSVIQHVVQRSKFGHVRQCQRIPAIGSFRQPSHITCKCFVPRQMKVTNTISYLVTAEYENFHFQYIVANFFSKMKPLSKEIRFGEENVQSNYYNGRESKIIKFCSSTVQWPVEHRFLSTHSRSTDSFLHLDENFTQYWAQYIDLARAKSEALDNIYGLFKQNIKSCNAKRRRQRRRR